MLLLLSDLAWPVIILILGILLLTTQRESVGHLIDRMKSIKVAGNEVSLSESHAATVAEAAVSLAGNVGDSLNLGNQENVAPDGSGNIAHANNREPVEAVVPLRKIELANIVELRTKLENFISTLTSPPPSAQFTTIDRKIDVLLNRGVITSHSAAYLKEIVDIADQAAAGAAVPSRLTRAVTNSGPAILEQLALLGRTAAARCEQHVLDVLQEEIPAEWSVETDVAFDAIGATGAPLESSAKDPEGVDALVTHKTKQVIVEVRPRLRSGSRQQIAKLTNWLAALPEHVPVLLVLLGSGLRDHELRQLRADRKHPIDVLLWDIQSESLIPQVRKLLEESP